MSQTGKASSYHPSVGSQLNDKDYYIFQDNYGIHTEK